MLGEEEIQKNQNVVIDIRKQWLYPYYLVEYNEQRLKVDLHSFV